MQIANVTIQLPFAILIFLKPHWAPSDGNIPDHNISFIAARSNGAKQHAKSQKRYLILQPSTKGSRSRSFIMFDRYCHDHTNLYIGGKPNDNGAVKIPFNKEQVPLPQGPHAEGWNNQADDERGGALLFYSSPHFCQSLPMGPFFRSGCQTFLISLTRRRFMWSTSVLSTSHSEWKKLPHLAFPVAAAAALSSSFAFVNFHQAPACLSSFTFVFNVCKLCHIQAKENLPRGFCNAESASTMTHP